jgi:glycosyltransferase involved in cell wall biosynthesis
MPKVSVILTSFNHAPYVGAAIESVLGQSFTDFELIVWDDASSDESWSIIQRYSDPRIKAFRNEEPRRAIFGVNKAIAEIASGEYVAMHHSDDVWEPDKLRKQVDFLDRHPAVGAVFSDAAAIDEQGAPFPDPEHFYSSVFQQPNRSRFEWLRHFFFQGNALCHPSVLIRTRCYEEVGAYRYGFAQVGDCDMWIRLCFRHEIHVLPEKLVRFRVSQAERNTSGSRPDTRRRWITESYHLLENYRRIRTYAEMVAIFPEAKEYHRKGGFEPLFVLAMIALGEHPFHFTKLFGIELLYELVGDAAKAKKIKALYGFDYRDLIAITAKHDVFSHEYAADLARSLAERDARIEELGRLVAARESDVHHMHAAVAERDRAFAQARAAVAARRADVDNLEAALAERDARIEELGRLVAARESDVHHMHVAVAERDRAFAEVRAAVAARRADVDKLEAAIAARDQRLAELGGLVEEQKGRLTAIEQEVIQREALIASMEGQAREQERRAAELVQKDAEREAEVHSLVRMLAQRDQQVERLTGDVDALQCDLNHMHAAVNERDQRAARLAAEFAARDARALQLVQAQEQLDRRIAQLAKQVGHAEGTWGARVSRALAGAARLNARRWRRELADCPLMDAAWYLANYPDVAKTRLDPVLHYLAFGWKEGREPGPDFDGAFYLSRYPDVGAGGVPPLLHFWRHGRFENRHINEAAEREFFARQWREQLSDCPLMDSAWYLENNPDVARGNLDAAMHYLTFGWREGRPPGPDFDGKYYLERYPDVAAAGVPPLVHYWLNGRTERRHPTRAAELLHRKHSKWYRRLLRCPLFDGEWYLRKYPETANEEPDPAWHYVLHGWKQNRQAGPEFDIDYYRRRYPDVVKHDGPLVLHYWRRGRFEGRCPNEALDFELLQANARVPGISPDTVLELDTAALDAHAGPYITVIVPTYNRVQRLPGIIECWRAVAERTSFPFEIIFSDDGSSDQSVEYLESVRGLPLRVLRNEHGGPARARNAAIRAATGERLLFVGDDIYPEPDILNAHAALGRRLGRLVATLGEVYWHLDLHVNHLMHHITEIGNEQFSYNRLPEDALTDFRHFYTCNVCIDRGLLLEEGVSFDETFDRAAFEDVELAYRLALRGLRLFYTRRARGSHYHPYQVEGFCRRQAGTGEMAVIFAKLHPAADRALRICAISRMGRAGRGVSIPESAWKDRVEALKRRCGLYEAIVSAVPIEASHALRQRLSAIYARLFGAMYEFGALQRLGYANALAVAMGGRFDASWNAYWEALEQAPDVAVDWQAGELLDLANALASKDDGQDLYRQRQRALLAELQCIPSLEFTAQPPHQPDTARFETAVPALVVERGDPGRSEAVARFHHLFGAKGQVYEPAGNGLFARVREGGKAGKPLGIADLEATVFHWPSRAASMLAPAHLLAAFMSVVENGVGLAVVSHSLAEGVCAAAGELRDQLVFSRDLLDAVDRSALGETAFSGKLLRLPSATTGMKERFLDSLLGAEIELQGDGFFHSRRHAAPARSRYLPGYLPPYATSRPVVLVFPIFLAVGGVERNLVEVMRKLKTRFDFLVVTMERLRPEQGSLAPQASEVATRVIEMAEVCGQADYLRVLHRIREAYRPDLVWVCNGSPWFCDNAAEIRSLFRDVPIVDQEAYDTEQGWINRYGEAGIRSFDFFVAVNRKIERRFLEDFRIAPERTRLIYSAIDAARIREFKATRPGAAEMRRKLGIPEGKRVFTFVARLTEQKRPLMFLELARRRLAHGDECFVLVGDGELAPQALEFIANHALTNVVRIAYVANTLELHQVSDAILFTSAYEGLPIAMLEALSMGVPAFSTDVGDIADVLKQYRSGAVIPVDASPEQVEQAFAHFVSRREELAGNARAAADAVIERFSSEAIAKLHADLWHDALGEYAKDANRPLLMATTQ